MSVTLQISRDCAEALIDAAIDQTTRQPFNPHLQDALETLVEACGILGPDRAFGDWYANQLKQRKQTARAEIAELKERVSMALGFAFTKACTLLDDGMDPRNYEMPGLLDEWNAALPPLPEPQDLGKYSEVPKEWSEP